jgi:hypothetical protein
VDEKRKEELKKLIMGRQAKLESNRAPMVDIWNKVGDFVNIGLGPISNQTNDIKTFLGGLGKRVYNGSAISAAILATDGIHGYHVSPAFPWFSYMMSRNVLNKVPEITEWLQDEKEEVYSALNNSNFYSEMWNFIYNGFTVGTVSIYGEMDYDTGRIVFETIHPREAFFTENKYGIVDVFHRKYRLSAKKLYERFGDKVPQSIKTAYKNSPFDEFEVIHACFPREERDTRKKDKLNKKYCSVWFATGSGDIMDESGFDEFPYAVWRYMKFSGYDYGLSPAIMAMADIESLNIISKTMLGAAQLYVDPPLNVPSDYVGQVQWKPRGINPYDKENMFIRPAQLTGQYPVGVDREERIERSIKERFHVDTFLMLSSLERGNRTAYEVSEMMGEKAAILGAELAPLNAQMDKILDLVYFLKAGTHPENGGTINPMPDIMHELIMEGDSFSPIYLGPLAQAQRRLYKTQGMQGAIEAIIPIIKISPKSARVIKGDESLRVILESFNYPQSAIASEDEIREMDEQEAEAAKQLQMKDELMQLAQGAKTVSETDKNMGGVIANGINQGMGENQGAVTNEQQT